MFWRFGFSSTSALDSLLDKPNVTLEEVLDEDDLLQECKAQNGKLLDFLQQPRVLKRLLEHVVGTAHVGGSGGSDWEEKVRFKYPYIASEVLSCEVWALVEAIFNDVDGLLVTFWDAILSASPPELNQSTVPQHMHPLFSHEDGNDRRSEDVPDGDPRREDADEVTSFSSRSALEMGGQHERDNGSGSGSGSASSGQSAERLTSAREEGPGRSVLAGYWAKVNGVFLDRKPKEMLAFIKSLPRVVERFVAHLETPAVVDLLYRIIQCEESVSEADVIDWLAEQGFVPQVVSLLSPSHSVDLHNTVSELLKAIIALSAPSPATMAHGAVAENEGFASPNALGAQGQLGGGVNNRLIRELAGEPMVRRMVAFMLDEDEDTSSTRKANSPQPEIAPDAPGVGDGAEIGAAEIVVRKGDGTSGASGEEAPVDEGTHPGAAAKTDPAGADASSSSGWQPLNPRDTPASETRPAVSSILERGDPEVNFHHLIHSTSPPRAPTVPATSSTRTSSLVTCIGIFIELIRKNNSDYFEQHLFHTLRNHLLQRQQEAADQRAAALRTHDSGKDDGSDGNQINGAARSEEDDMEMQDMEDAMAELSKRLGIVHLGPMLRVLCERIPDFQARVIKSNPETNHVSTTIGSISALTFERYRITELYAELLHCSNMALLNRAHGEGPQYSDDGVLQGGIEGLQILARTLQGGEEVSVEGPGIEMGAGASTDEHQALRSLQATGNQTEGRGFPADVKRGGDHGDVDPDKDKKEDHVDDHDSREESPSSPSRKHSRERSTHTRTGSVISAAKLGSHSNISDDTDDEALLNEVSLDNDPATMAPGEDPFGDEGAVASGSNAEPSSDHDGTEILATAAQSDSSEADCPLPRGQSETHGPRIDPRPDMVIGDVLKRKFLECDVIPTILGLFFQYPWNNFLHNVVYDILQQFFNGRMDATLNRHLTIAVFEQGRLTSRIVEGHRENEKSLMTPRRVRLGYMGHLNLIAEETVKLLERYPREIADAVSAHTKQSGWQDFVEHTLRENREKEAAPLAGGRPAMQRTINFGTAAMHPGPDDVHTSSVMADVDTDSDAFASYLSAQMGGQSGGSDDEDSDEEQQSWPHGREDPDGLHSSNFDDAFQPAPEEGLSAHTSHAAHFDDDWGDFANAESDTGFDAMEGDGKVILTGTLGTSSDEDGASHGHSALVAGAAPENANAARSQAVEEILEAAPLDVVGATHARRPSMGKEEASDSGREASGRSNHDGEPANTFELCLSDALGPGVAPDAKPTEDGKLERTIDGESVRVPLDELALVSGGNEVESETADRSQ